VGDRALVEAIDLLSRRTTDGKREFVDYRTLGVRHLGSIYEGLLEYQPRYAGEPMVAVREDKGERWVKAAEVPEGARVVVRRGVGQVYLETDRGERRATGSYYTPQYIVEYIVEQAVGPLVKEAVERVKARGKQAKGKAARAAAGRSLVEEVLRLKILDPAMGSGHFLVEVTEYLARALATDPYVETGVPAEEDLTHWKRRVVERCIYGVDRNRLAVELAKLSLWLATVAEDKPLSFLDHHLQCGDSLIGARVADLGAVPPVVLSKKALREREAQYAAGVRQANLFEIRLIEKLPVVMGRILEITEVESDSYETVQAKEAADRAVRELKAPFEAVANLWVSAYFGNEFTQGEYDEALGLVGRPGELLALPAVGWAQEAARERRFFHWELAYPEVFYDRNGQPLRAGAGFDAVVGNPPYGFIADKAVQTILSNTYHAVSSFDLYIAFLERGIQLLRRQGILSYIAPTSWQTGIAHQDFREYSLRTCQIARIVDLPYDVFPDAYIDTSIYVLKKELTPEEASTLLNRPVLAYKFGKRAQAATGLSGALAYEVLDSGDWLGDPQLRFVTDKGVLNLRETLANLPQVSLGELTDTARGILAGEADLSAMPLGPDWKPYFDGDVYRYQLNWEPKMWVQYGPALREKPSDYHYFLGPRILVRRLISRQARLMATLVSEEFVNTKDLYNVLVAGERHNPLFLAALLNSLLFSHLYIAQSTVASRDDFPQVTLADLRKLPIRHIAFATPAGERARLEEIGITEVTEWVEHTEGVALVSSSSFSAFSDSALGRWLEARLTAEPEQSDVVHDLLAHLAECMIRMNQEKQAEVRGFLAWLVREAGAPVESLAHRARLQDYLGDYQKGEPYLTLDELLEILRRNRRRLQADLSARAFQERLAREYQASLDKLLPLKVRLAATDRLIDLVVYRLYGLTEEEVAAVGGR